MVSVLDSGAEGPGFKSQSRRCRATVLGKLFTPIVIIHQAAKLVAALLRVARVTAGLAESNGSLPPGLWLTSPAGWLPRTGISSGTLRSAVDYGLTFLFLITRSRRQACQGMHRPRLPHAHTHEYIMSPAPSSGCNNNSDLADNVVCIWWNQVQI